MFHRCLIGVWRICHECVKKDARVFLVFQRGWKGSRVLQSFENVPRKFWGCFTEVCSLSAALQGAFMGISQVFQGGYVL